MAKNISKNNGVNKGLNGQVLFMKSRGGDLAKCMITEKGFVLLKGSWIRPTTQKSCLKNVAKLRKEYAGKIKGNKLTVDVRFGSSSYAAGFVSGLSKNGKTAWYDAEGRTLKELEK